MMKGKPKPAEFTEEEQKEFEKIKEVEGASKTQTK